MRGLKFVLLLRLLHIFEQIQALLHVLLLLGEFFDLCFNSASAAPLSLRTCFKSALRLSSSSFTSAADLSANLAMNSFSCGAQPARVFQSHGVLKVLLTNSLSGPYSRAPL